jgi:small GTP-binding protein
MSICLLGDPAVGKTAIMNRYVRDNFRPITEPTVGAGSSELPVETDSGPVNLKIWDTAGQEIYRSMSPHIIKSSDVVLLVFDLTNHQTFDHIGYWNAFASEHMRPRAIKYIVGNKLDLEEQRQVSSADAESVAQATGAAQYLECSAANGLGVRAIFQAAAMNITAPAQPLELILRDDRPRCC